MFIYIIINNIINILLLNIFFLFPIISETNYSIKELEIKFTCEFNNYINLKLLKFWNSLLLHLIIIVSWNFSHNILKKYKK
jgi:hypothetical protein